MKHELIRPFAWTRCDDGYRWVTGPTTGAASKTTTVLWPNSEKRAPYAPDRSDELFLTLASTPPTEEGILSFASAHGYLGIEVRTVSQSGVVRMGEPLEGWTVAIAELSYVVDRWAAARGRVTLAGDESGFGWIDLRDGLNEHLRHHVALEMMLTEKRGIKRAKTIQVGINPNRKPVEFRKHGLQLVARNLLGYCWLQLALAVDSEAQFKRCPACQKWLVVRPSGKRTPQFSCSAACKSRLAYYRDRHRSGHISLAEIARRVGSSVPAVKGWIGRRAHVAS